jgi:gliding motility associated protien GldN
MKNRSIFCCLVAALSLVAITELNAQFSERPSQSCVEKPMDGIYTSGISKRAPLAIPHLEERDVLWEKRIWREIDVKEKRNHHFASPNRFFINILFEGLEDKKIRAFSAENENFTKEIAFEDIKKMLNTNDTIEVEDPTTGEISFMPITNSFDPMNVVKYRIKEVVYFDAKNGQMNTRILGIAPIVNLTDNQGNLVATTALCWFHYDDLRPLLAREAMPSDASDLRDFSWDDVFQARVFASLITKESNVKDVRLQDQHSGMAVLYESEKIKENIRNIEADFFGEN